MGVGVDADTLSKALRLGLRRDRAGPRGRARQTRAAHQARPPGIGIPGGVDAEVEADFARTMGLSKMAELRGRLLELSGTPAREEATQTRQTATTLHSPSSTSLINRRLSRREAHGGGHSSSADGSFYNRRKPNILME
jgi:hypothetical protein